MDAVGAKARFKSPSDVAVDNIGNIYVADTSNHRIRKITSEGTVLTVAGMGPWVDETAAGMGGFADGSGDNSMFASPMGVAVDASGNVYVADHENNRIRKITVSP